MKAANTACFLTVLSCCACLAQGVPTGAPAPGASTVPSAGNTLHQLQLLELVRAQQEQLESDTRLRQAGAASVRQGPPPPPGTLTTAGPPPAGSLTTSGYAGQPAVSGSTRTGQAQIDAFLRAITSRRNRWRDFDHLVFESHWPVTPDMLGLIAESPYAADLAYYLAGHATEAQAIASMPPQRARATMKALAARVAVAAPPPAP
jgi:hypothetical protein